MRACVGKAEGVTGRDTKPCVHRGSTTASFRNQSIPGFVSSQPSDKSVSLSTGDGSWHWNLLGQLATRNQVEILDWVSLEENLYKVGGSFKTWLEASWNRSCGQVKWMRQRLLLIADVNGLLISVSPLPSPAVISYSYYQAEQFNWFPVPLSPVWKQIDRRLKISRHSGSLKMNQALQLHVAYLNDLLAILIFLQNAGCSPMKYKEQKKLLLSRRKTILLKSNFILPLGQDIVDIVTGWTWTKSDITQFHKVKKDFGTNQKNFKEEIKHTLEKHQIKTHQNE